MNKTPLKKVYNIQPSRDSEVASSPSYYTEQTLFSETYTDGTTNNGNTAKTQPRVITASELREPLLESGTADVYDVDPSSVPTRVQTSYK